jgi:hypothetical protein
MVLLDNRLSNSSAWAALLVLNSFMGILWVLPKVYASLEAKNLRWIK